MLCPVCARALRPVERQGIEIDHCVHCGGFWLDAGELDTLIRQEAALALQAGQQALRLARNEREYDQTADSFATSAAVPASAGRPGYRAEDPLQGATAVLRRAATAAAARSR